MITDNQSAVLDSKLIAGRMAMVAGIMLGWEDLS